jgi:flagellin
MRAQIRSYAVAGRNAQDGVSLAQTAEGSLQEVSNILTACASCRPVVQRHADHDRPRDAGHRVPATHLRNRPHLEPDAFNGVNLLDGSATSLGHPGRHQRRRHDHAEPLRRHDDVAGHRGLDVTSVANAGAGDHRDRRGDRHGLDLARRPGRAQNRCSRAIASIANARENLSAAESRIRDVDVASETADLTRNSILQQAAVSVLSQANVQPQLALSLLQ